MGLLTLTVGGWWRGSRAEVGLFVKLEAPVVACPRRDKAGEVKSCPVPAQRKKTTSTAAPLSSPSFSHSYPKASSPNA